MRNTALLLILLVYMVGCKKYPLATDTNLIKTIAYNNQPPSQFLFYDARYRLIADSEATGVIRYTYSGDTLAITFSNFGQNGVTYLYYLNAQGRDAANGNGNYYYYNQQGQNTVAMNGADTTLHIWSNGDLVKELFINFPDTTVTNAFTYLNIPDNRNFGLQYQGRSSYHLLSGNREGEIYSYTFDAQGRVSSMSVSTNGRGAITSYTYY